MIARNVSRETAPTPDRVDPALRSRNLVRSLEIVLPPTLWIERQSSNPELTRAYRQQICSLRMPPVSRETNAIDARNRQERNHRLCRHSDESAAHD